MTVENNLTQNLPLISIIVPAYNVENYVAACLKTLIEQTYKNLEIIVINDGSTDNTLSIVNEFVSKDNRIKVITQPNGGPSVSRNKGIDIAKGEYIAFVDSDDWVDNDFVEKLYNAIKETGSDIACASIIRYREKSQKYRVHYTEQKIYSTLSDKINTCRIPKCCYVWNKLYKTSIIKNYKFKEGALFEDVLWLPKIIEVSGKLVTVPNITYYYRVNKNSIVKKCPSAKTQQDSYYAKKYIINFFEKNGLKLSEKDYNITKSIKYLCNIPFLKIKENKNTEKGLLFGVLPVYKKNLKTPVIKDNTFLVWEPCSKSHSEVVPGYAKYLLDLGYHVSVLVNPMHYKDGLFSRFKDENISYNKMSRKEIKEFFKRDSLEQVKGVIVTTGGKLCDKIRIEDCYKTFNPLTDRKKLFFVFHDAQPAVDEGTWREDLITLRKLDYKGAKSTVINPHYFGDVKITPKNDKITNFITIGAIQAKKKNNELIVGSVKKLYDEGYRNFKVTVVGKGSLKHLPKELRPYFDIKGRLPFDKMYDEIEKADFLLTSYEDTNPNHVFYRTSGTSGAFQLVYGFCKPCIIKKSFAPVNNFDNTNSIIYNDDNSYVDALKSGIEMSKEEYKIKQDNLYNYTKSLYTESLNNLRRLINA